VQILKYEFMICFRKQVKIGSFSPGLNVKHVCSRNSGGSPGIETVRRWSYRHVWESPRLFGVSDIKGSRESNDELGSVAD